MAGLLCAWKKGTYPWVDLNETNKQNFPRPQNSIIVGQKKGREGQGAMSTERCKSYGLLRRAETRAGFRAPELGRRESLTETQVFELRLEWGLGVNSCSRHWDGAAEGLPGLLRGSKDSHRQDKDSESTMKKQTPIPNGSLCSYCAVLIRISWQTGTRQEESPWPLCWASLQQSKAFTPKTISSPGSGFFCWCYAT